MTTFVGQLYTSFKGTSCTALCFIPLSQLAYLLLLAIHDTLCVWGEMDLSVLIRHLSVVQFGVRNSSSSAPILTED